VAEPKTSGLARRMMGLGAVFTTREILTIGHGEPQYLLSLSIPTGNVEEL